MVRAAALLVLTALGCARAVRYRAAVVEFSPARATVAGLATWTKQEAWQHSLANVERFSPFLDEAARNGSQIVVFPEYAITGDGTTDGDELTRAGADMLSEAVPDPGGATPPCDAPDGGTVYPVTSRLSCMARKSAVVLVADLLDRQPCEAPADPGCADGKFLFNTAVAFDPQGQLIAKYHKRHLYGGEGRTLDRGSQPAGARFNTSFGVEFGLFICFDLLFINGSIPPSDVAFPTDWVNFDQGGLPVERSVDAQRIWSGLHRRNLLASNYGGFGRNSSGSGIWESGRKLAEFFNPTTSPANKLLIADVESPQLARKPRPRAIRVGCVGDSITAGYLASPKSMAYPAQLQTQLAAHFGNGSYEVSNFGAGGATVQRGADSPYWNRTQFAAWVNGTYDIIVIMLGTNDAKVSTAECVARWGPTSSMCADNWPVACSAASPTPETCPVIHDYLALIALAGTLGTTSGRSPLITIMTPPPLWKDGAYGMSNAVLNDAMPTLVPQISRLAGLPPPIDLYTTMGGVQNWRSTFPVCGCQRPPGAAAAVAETEPAGVAGAAVGNYSGIRGYMAIGEVIASASLSWSAAATACSSDAACAGFTFKSNASQPAAQVGVRLKQCVGVTPNSQIGWWSWTKPPGSVPAPRMPASCALFCQDGQSCDPCHPDNDGYALLATQVFRWIVAANGAAARA